LFLFKRKYVRHHQYKDHSIDNAGGNKSLLTVRRNKPQKKGQKISCHLIFKAVSNARREMVLKV
jgi:hypothetical protein